ncbi:MAG: helix-turn-helix transcriptional regulator [Clostridiales bacterium]|nr:helix-turn-helix transcriptional regulator [Clostridiales bacterium]
MKEIKFAENLKQLRTSKGLYQHDLAQMVGVDKRTISAWEKGVSQPSLEMIAKLCEIFDESFDNMLT